MHQFQMGPNDQSGINQVPTMDDYLPGRFIIIDHNGVLRLSKIVSADLSLSTMTVSACDPPLPSLLFYRSRSPSLRRLKISTDQFRASLLSEPEQLANDKLRISNQQLVALQVLWESE
jgi:hypothetical protein